jgi:hypothetical protein
MKDGPAGSFGYCAICYHPLDVCSHCDHARLRSALVALVGVDGREALEELEAYMRRDAIAPAADKAVSIDAIHALIATLPTPTSAPGQE